MHHKINCTLYNTPSIETQHFDLFPLLSNIEFSIAFLPQKFVVLKPPSPNEFTPMIIKYSVRTYSTCIIQLYLYITVNTFIIISKFGIKFSKSLISNFWSIHMSNLEKMRRQESHTTIDICTKDWRDSKITVAQIVERSYFMIMID